MQNTSQKQQPKVFTPGKIGGLTLRNRTIRAGCFEGMCPNATPGEALLKHHQDIAHGGIGMTTVSYCAVAKDGVAFGHEMWMRPDIIPNLKKMTDAIHAEGAAASVQLGHCGFFANKSAAGYTPMGPSRKFCMFRYSICRPMTEDDINRVREDFGKAAQMARQAGFDAVEIHSGHGYLMSQFLSPWTNHRKDQYGGSLENRMRFPASVIEHVRKVMGPDFPIMVKMNTEDCFKGGLTIDESVQVAKRFEEAGASALIPSCGFTAKTSFHMMRGKLPKKEYIKYEKNMVTKIGLQLFSSIILKIVPFEEMFLFEQSKKIMHAVKIPVVYVGGVCSIDNMAQAMNEGFEFVELGRATIKDPNFVNKMISGEITASDCDHCNKCVAEMSSPNGVKCVCNELAMAKK